MSTRKPPPPRPYHSPARQRQAGETRSRIADAARKLFLEKGYDTTTIDGIAQAAGVAGQTVYAVFGSKRGIVAEIMDRATFTSGYQEAIREALRTTEPEARLRFSARIARRIYDAERTEIDLLRGAGVLAPEIAELERGREVLRYNAQVVLIKYLEEHGRLRSDFTQEQGRAVLWTLTGREAYRMLVVDRGWTSDAYEQWLADLIVAALIAPKATRKK